MEIIQYGKDGIKFNKKAPAQNESRGFYEIKPVSDYSTEISSKYR